MGSDHILAGKGGLVTINKFCEEIVQVNFVLRGMTMYFSNENFLELANAFNEASSQLLDIGLANIFKEFDQKKNEE